MHGESPIFFGMGPFYLVLLLTPKRPPQLYFLPFCVDFDLSESKCNSFIAPVGGIQEASEQIEKKENWR